MVQALERVSLGDIKGEALSIYMKILFERHLATYFEKEEKYIQESYTNDIREWAESTQMKQLLQSASVDMLDLLHRNFNFTTMKKNFLVSMQKQVVLLALISILNIY
jgi:hypothetical protein